MGIMGQALLAASTPFIIVLAAIVYQEIRNRWVWRNVNIPGPPGLYFQSLLQGTQHHEIHHNLYKQYGPISRYFMLGWGCVSTSNAEDIERIATQDFLDKSTIVSKQLSQYFGNGIVTLKQNMQGYMPWKRHRMLLDQAFKIRCLRIFEVGWRAHAKKLVNKLLEKKGTEVDLLAEILQEMYEISLDFIGAAPKTPEFRRTLQTVMDSFTSPLLMLPYGGAILKFLNRDSWKVVDEFIYKAIKDRRAEGVTEDAQLTLLDLLISCEQEGLTLDDEEVRDHLVMIYVAGFENSANALGFFFRDILSHPEFFARIQSEIDAVTENTFDSLKELKFTKTCINESLRLHPPTIVTARTPVEDYLLPSGYIIPKGESIFINLYEVQRSPKYWSDPEVYNPCRFIAEENGGKVEPNHPYAFIPFLKGPRMCIGKDFFYYEALALVHTILSNLSLKLVPCSENDQIISPHGLIGLKALKVHVESR